MSKSEKKPKLVKTILPNGDEFVTFEEEAEEKPKEKNKTDSE